jgi:sugar phosphate isomerase/epimerase
MGLALSTSWNAFRYQNAPALIQEIKSLGFTAIELSFNLTSLMVDEIQRASAVEGMRITSVHNFCPIPQGLKRETVLPDYFAVSSPDAEERARAVEETKRTIATASRLGAKAVVLHTGRVEIENHNRELIALYDKGMRDSAEFLHLKDLMIKERDSSAPGYFENTLKSLDELNRYAEKNDIVLGIENRFYYREIPSFEEIRILLDTFRGGAIRYWHDTGHAQVMERLGFSTQRQYLEAYQADLYGIHIHNVFGCDDHRAPQDGDIDFRTITPFLTKHTLKVIETHAPAPSHAIEEGRRYMENILDAKL